MMVRVIKEEIGYSAILKDFGIFTQGEDFEELIKNIKEALELYYENTIKKEVFLNEFSEFDLVLN